MVGGVPKSVGGALGVVGGVLTGVPPPPSPPFPTAARRPRPAAPAVAVIPPPDIAPVTLASAKPCLKSRSGSMVSLSTMFSANCAENSLSPSSMEEPIVRFVICLIACPMVCCAASLPSFATKRPAPFIIPPLTRSVMPSTAPVIYALAISFAPMSTPMSCICRYLSCVATPATSGVPTYGIIAAIA